MSGAGKVARMDEIRYTYGSSERRCKMRNPPDRPEGTDENILEQTLKKYIFNT
jgi:hypothetical protein